MDIFRKHGDLLLFTLALAVLISLFYRLNFSSVNYLREAASRPTVVFSHWWEGYLPENTLMALKDEFEILHQGISIVFDNRSYEEIRESLFKFEFAEGAPGAAEDPGGPQAPEAAEAYLFGGDLFAFDLLWAPELIHRGLIDENWNDQRGGQILSYINVLYYNIDILKEAGFSSPPKTRNEFLDYARAVSDGGNNRWALSLDLAGSRGIYYDIFPWIWAAGLELIRNNRPEVNNRQLIDSLGFIASLFNEGLVVPEAFSAGAGNKLEDFVSGRAAFIIAPEWDIVYVRERMGEESFSVTNIPIPDNYMGRTFYSAGSWALEVNPASRVSAEARLFADFLAGRSAFLSEKAGTISGTNIPRPGSDPHFSKIWDIAIDAEIAGEFRGFPWTPLEEIFREELAALIAPDSAAQAGSPVSESSHAAAAAAIQRRWLEVLDNLLSDNLLSDN